MNSFHKVNRSNLVSEQLWHWVELQSLGNNVETKHMSVYSQSSHGLHLVATLDPDWDSTLIDRY